MKEYLKKYGGRLAVIVIAAAFLVLLGAATRSGVGFVQNVTGIVAAPMQKVLSSTVNWFNSMYGYLYRYDAMMEENQELRTQLAEAQQAAREGIAASEENVRLRQSLELRQKHTDYVLESAKVVLWSASNWSSSFTISKGRSSGIELGETWATVSTVIDVDMSVGAYVGVAGSSGKVDGEFTLMKEGTAKLGSLADGVQIFEGDEVLTSGSGGAFPAGLVIGTISNVQTEAGGQIEFGIVVPQCELDTLVQVFIIKDFTVVE